MEVHQVDWDTHTRASWIRYSTALSFYQMAWNLQDLEASLLIGSTLVEGSTLTEDEARDVLAGRTVTGHSVRELRELTNYRAAVGWLMGELDKSPYVSMDLVLGFHRTLFQGLAGEPGYWKSRQNFTYRPNGSRHDYLHPAHVEQAMHDWLVDFNSVPGTDEIAKRGAHLYWRFQDIHPFEDGNGRIGRILLAYWLHWKGSSAWQFYARDKLVHLEALEAADRGDHNPLIHFVAQRMHPETSP